MIDGAPAWRCRYPSCTVWDALVPLEDGRAGIGAKAVTNLQRSVTSGRGSRPGWAAKPLIFR